MNELQKEFIPYELALRMKELGFDEPCLAYHNQNGIIIEEISSALGNNKIYLAPTFSQAFRWFREKHGFDLNWKPMSMVGITCYYDIEIHHPKYVWDKPPKAIGKTYDEAELACLLALVELIENK
jgi:hypothetical protein